MKSLFICKRVEVEMSRQADLVAFVQTVVAFVVNFLTV